MVRLFICEDNKNIKNFFCKINAMKIAKVLTTVGLASGLAISTSLVSHISPVSACSGFWGSLDPTCKGRIFGPKTGPEYESEVGCPHCNQNKTSACVNLSSRQGWQSFNFPTTFTRITSIEGSWSVDSRSYANVGAYGHTGDAANRLAPYNQYKYDQQYPFGRLLVDIPNYGYISIDHPQTLPREISSTAMRINDQDNALGDNAGLLRVCFGR